MNIISLSKDRFNTPQKNLVFSANQKAIQKKMIQGLSENLFSNVMQAADSLELSTIINDPKKNKVFFATLGSLMTAAAIKITELITGSEKEKEVNERIGDKEFSEKSSVAKKTKSNQAVKGESYLGKLEKQKTPKLKAQKYLRHTGKLCAHERALEASIESTVQRLGLDTETRNSLVSLYNRFCGVNYKDVSYDKENNELKNAFVSQSMIAGFEKCVNKNDIDDLIALYNSYSKEKNEDVSVLHSNIEVPQIIKEKVNLHDAYVNLNEDDRKDVDEFLNSIKEDENNNKFVQKSLIQNLNKNYFAQLPQIAVVYELLEKESEDEKQLFLSLLSNHLVSSEALENYASSQKLSKAFNFNEYNSLVYGNVSNDAIEELVRLKNKGDILEIKKSYVDDTFDLSLYSPFLGESLQTLSNVFGLLRDEDSKGLQSQDSVYDIRSMETEIRNKAVSYPNLRSYLSLERNDSYNYGKIVKLLEIYNGAKINKDLFTIHSYLRFLERFVIPNVKPSSDGKIGASQIRNIYKAKVGLLKESMMEALRKSVNIEVYSFDEAGIKAPRFKVPYDKDGNCFTVTINDQGKIHTIF